MHIWLLSLGLVFVSYTCSVCSQKCGYDWDCDRGKQCCSGSCKLEQFCARCFSDGDCSPGGKCGSDGICQLPAYVPATDPNNILDEYCVWHSDCSENRRCEEGKCVFTSLKATNKIIGTVLSLFASVVTVSCAWYCIRIKRERKRTELAARNATSSRARNGLSLNATTTAVEPGSVVSNDATVIEMEQVSPPLPPDAPPPYSSLDFERQGNDNDEAEQPPPSYDEAVRTDESTEL